jgi:hypothetical protein
VSGMQAIVELFRAAVDGQMAALEAEQRSAAYLSQGVCNGYWHGEPGMLWQGESM